MLAGHAHPRLYRGLIKNRSGSEPLLEALGTSPGPIGPPTCSALLLGLSAKNGSERARAVDAVIDLAGRAALPGVALGRVLADLLAADALVGSRVAQAMAEAARADARAGTALLDCLTEVVAALPGRRDAHHFLDLLARLASERGRVVIAAGAVRERGEEHEQFRARPGLPPRPAAGVNPPYRRTTSPEVALRRAASSTVAVATASRGSTGTGPSPRTARANVG